MRLLRRASAQCQPGVELGSLWLFKNTEESHVLRSVVHFSAYTAILMHEFAVARLLFSSSLWKDLFSKAGTEKRTTLFHNVSFVTALKSSELGERANKEGPRGVHCAAPPWPRPSKNFHSMQSGARLCDTFEMKEMPDLICEEICIFWSTNIMDFGTQNEMIWYISQVLAFWYSLDLFGTVWIWSWYYGEIQLGANYLQMHGIFIRMRGFIMCKCVLESFGCLNA